MTEFTVKYETMSPQRHVLTGEVKLDKHGNPLASVKILQSKSQREQMVKRMKRLDEMYRYDPAIWDKQRKYSIGNDPYPMSAEKIFTDLEKKFIDWAKPTGHILKQYVDRHNHMMDVYIIEVNKTGVKQLINDLVIFEQKCRIDLVEDIPLRAKMLEIMNSNPIFEVE